MNKEQIEAEIAAIRAKREGKRGRMPNVDRDRIAELEAQLKEPEMSDETADEIVETPGMKRIMIMHHNAGMPGGQSGGAVKIFQFDVVETTAEHADALCSAMVDGQPMARETKDDVTVRIEDGRRVVI